MARPLYILIYLYVLYLYLNISLHLCPTCKIHLVWLWFLHCFKEVIRQKNKTREDRNFKNEIIVLKVCTLRRTEKTHGKNQWSIFGRSGSCRFTLVKCSQRIWMLSNWHLCIVITCLKAFEFESHDADKKGRQKQAQNKKIGMKKGRKEALSVKYHI